MAVRLEWDGKPQQAERLILPFQSVETINESRATRERNTGALFGGAGGDRVNGSRNQLIWGDNKLIMSSLLEEYAGQVQLIYIDPPFATGADFSVKLKVGDDEFVKQPSILEEHAYRDTWGHGYDSYLTMMYERLLLMRELLSADGTIYVHCDWRLCHALKLMLDEIFGADRFMCQIIWKRSSIRKAASKKWLSVDDVLLVATKSSSFKFNTVYLPYSEDYKKRFNQRDENGAFYWIDIGTYSEERLERLKAEGRVRFPDTPGAHPRIKHYLHEGKGVQPDNVWTDIAPINSQAKEDTGYDTQKPEALLRRIIEASSNPGDLVADFFCGSGTTMAVAEQLGRRWIGCDLGRFAIHTTRKRLLNIPDCGPFDVMNLGMYERQRWQVASGNGAVRAYLDTILAFYRAEPVEGFAHLHGRKANRMVHVGATDAPVTIDETEEVMDEMADNGIESCDLLGWEWEMGLHGTITERARRRGLDVRPRQIPREVMERQVTDADAVRFFELAHVDLDVRRQGHEACVVLKDFAIPSEDLIPPKVREHVRLWSDLIDYWSVASTSATRSSTTSGRPIERVRIPRWPRRVTGTSTRRPGATRSSSKSSTSSATTRPSSPRSASSERRRSAVNGRRSVRGPGPAQTQRRDVRGQRRAGPRRCLACAGLSRRVGDVAAAAGVLVR
jgi:adenine-specific DNA-methyltransferase